MSDETRIDITDITAGELVEMVEDGTVSPNATIEYAGCSSHEVVVVWKAKKEAEKRRPEDVGPTDWREL